MRENRSIETQEMAVEDVKVPEVTDSGNLDKSITEKPEFSSESELDKWEISNGNYGQEFLGIKEICKEFPFNAQYSQLDKYIKAEINERGFDKTPTMWQNILKEIEMEAGSEKLNAIERLKRLAGYVQVLNNFKKAKQKRELYTLGNLT